MSSNTALELDQVSKTYHLYNSPKDRLKQVIMRGKRQYYREFQALNNLSFTLPKGEVLGVVGRNGAGKSTLLQLICGTLTPTSGQVQVNGRIAALLELGAGFNPQFSGRENIYLSASIMGINKREIDGKIDDIIDYAGVREFIDQPVSTYSSGMYVRLAFSVATSIDPDILIIDEALSVGDGDFARRSFERIMAMKEQGATILFCSHSLYQIEALCSKAIWLEKGNLVKVGDPSDIISDYQAFLDLVNQNPAATPVDLKRGSINTQTRPLAYGEYARLQGVTASTAEGQGSRLAVVSGETNLTLEINFVSTLKGQTPQVAIAIHNAARQLISSTAAWCENVTPTVNSDGRGQVTVTLPKLPLLKGTYYIGVLLFDESGLFLHDEIDPAATIEVSQAGRERGLFRLPSVWQDTTQEARLKAEQQVTKRQPSERWRTRPSQADDLEQLKHIFQQAFGHPLDEATWYWKYQHAQSPGYVVLEDQQVVAFCGGIPRQGLVQDKETTFCQIGDVMVDPKKRGVLTKTGPFYRCVYPFMGEQIGQGKPQTFAFGFPNYRHLRIGERQKLYASFDKILEAQWPAAPAQFQLSEWRGDETIGDMIDQLWQNMRPHLAQHLVCMRDQAWLRHRYLNKPQASYQVLVVKGPKRVEPMGVIVVVDRPDSNQIELLDFIAVPENAQFMIEAAQQYAHRNSRSNVFAWLTPNVYRWLEGSNGQTMATDIVIPGNGLDDPAHTSVAIDNWWLMGGDSDFR